MLEVFDSLVEFLPGFQPGFSYDGSSKVHFMEVIDQGSYFGVRERAFVKIMFNGEMYLFAKLIKFAGR